jgi:crotonobetainyl-CoA:carnitine CoA-transferase CaiB-like acyl-CoA transferase
MDHALSDVTVIDLGQVIAMPFCTMLLADLRARVATTDGHVAIAAAASNAVWARFCAVIGRDDLTRAPEFATAARRDRRDEIATIIQQWTGARAKAEVVRTLASAGVPAAPVNNVAEMVADPQVRAREMFVELDHPVYGPLTTTGTPLKLSETPGRVRWLAPMPGEHNEEVFMGVLGHSPEELERWRAEGVI